MIDSQSQTSTDRLYSGWMDLLKPFAPSNEQVQYCFEQLVTRYCASDRHYHTLEHIGHLLQVIDQLTPDTMDATAIKLAGWFHDFIYQSQNQDNEIQSAAYATALLPTVNVPVALIAEIHRLILLTQYHSVAQTDLNGQILLDADLAILGTSPERYHSYTQQIRQEYAWLTDDAFRSGRRPVLNHFLQRDRIYQTEPMTKIAETQARINLTQELNSLL